MERWYLLVHGLGWPRLLECLYQLGRLEQLSSELRSRLVRHLFVFVLFLPFPAADLRRVRWKQPLVS